MIERPEEKILACNEWFKSKQTKKLIELSCYSIDPVKIKANFAEAFIAGWNAAKYIKYGETDTQIVKSSVYI